MTAPFARLGSLFGGRCSSSRTSISPPAPPTLSDDGPAEARAAGQSARRAPAAQARCSAAPSVPPTTARSRTRRSRRRCARRKQSARQLSGRDAPKRARGHGAKRRRGRAAELAAPAGAGSALPAQFHAAPVYPAEVSNASIGDGTGRRGGGGSATPAAASPSTAGPDGDQDRRASWLEQQLLAKFLPTPRSAMRSHARVPMPWRPRCWPHSAASRARVPDRSASGGGPADMSRMEL